MFSTLLMWVPIRDKTYDVYKIIKVLVNELMFKDVIDLEQTDNWTLSCSLHFKKYRANIVLLLLLLTQLQYEKQSGTIKQH